MFFIPRNNAIYNYLAHTNIKRRYCATLFVFITITIMSYYYIYMPLTAHIILSQNELTRLQKQYTESEQLEKSNTDLSLLIYTHKKNITEHVITNDKKEEWCDKHRQYVFDLITKLDLKLNSYGPCKEKDKKWYTKDSAPYQITGSLEKMLSFLKIIKESNQMIVPSNLVLTKVKDNMFQLNCDVGIITVKK